LTPDISQEFIQKQADLLEELENLKRMNKQNSGGISGDQLSYSQTININNLKSNDNLKSISDISAMIRKIAMDNSAD